MSDFRAVITGIVLLLAGCYVLLLRKENPEQPRKVYGLAPMQDVLGDRLGSVAHFLVLGFVPLGYGCFLLAMGFNLDRGWEREAPQATAGELKAREARDAELQLGMSEARLISDGFAVTRLEQGEGLRVSAAGFSGTIVKSDLGWRVDCGAKGTHEALSLSAAEDIVLVCYRPP